MAFNSWDENDSGRAADGTQQHRAGGGMGYGTAKKELAALHEAKFGKARDEYTRLLKDPGHVNEILLAGAAKARDIARPVLKRIRKAAGFYA